MPAIKQRIRSLLRLHLALHKSPVLRRDRSFPLSHWERVGERACGLGRRLIPVVSVYVLLSKLICLWTPPKKARVAISFQALPSVPSQREGKENFLCKAVAHCIRSLPLAVLQARTLWKERDSEDQVSDKSLERFSGNNHVF